MTSSDYSTIVVALIIICALSAVVGYYLANRLLKKSSTIPTEFQLPIKLASAIIIATLVYGAILMFSK